EEDKNKVKQFLNEDIEKQVKKYGKDINVFGVNEYMDEVILTKGVYIFIPLSFVCSNNLCKS
ncbi:DUF3798 domain-containing protein, partial [Clostridioides difficile]